MDHEMQQKIVDARARKSPNKSPLKIKANMISRHEEVPKADKVSP